jgi:hypothetical protein
MEKELSPRRARDARDAGLRRLQQLTGAAVAGALGLSAVFAGIAAGTTHPRRAAQTTRTHTATAATSDATTPPLPAPRAPGMATTPSATPTPTPPAVAPAAATGPPAAVSGGS